jgi:hypothetical protein
VRSGLVGSDTEWAGDVMPPDCQFIEIRIADLDQLFHTIDPSPFHARQLDRDAEEFIVGRAHEVPRDVPLGLTIYLDRPAGARPGDEAGALREAVHTFFARRARTRRRELGELFSRGRKILAIGLAFLSVTTLFGEMIGGAADPSQGSALVRESLIIAGWVAMWRPLEIFLYEWWPIRAEGRCYDRLATMPVAVHYTAGVRSGAA